MVRTLRVYQGCSLGMEVAATNSGVHIHLYLAWVGTQAADPAEGRNLMQIRHRQGCDHRSKTPLPLTSEEAEKCHATFECEWGN